MDKFAKLVAAISFVDYTGAADADRVIVVMVRALELLKRRSKNWFRRAKRWAY